MPFVLLGQRGDRNDWQTDDISRKCVNSFSLSISVIIHSYLGKSSISLTLYLPRGDDHFRSTVLVAPFFMNTFVAVVAAAVVPTTLYLLPILVLVYSIICNQSMDIPIPYGLFLVYNNPKLSLPPLFLYQHFG